MSVAEKIHDKMITIIIDPLIMLLTGGALIMFLYGLVIFMMNVEGQKKEEGKKHMMYGLLGLFIIFSVWGIVNFLGATIDSIQ